MYPQNTDGPDVPQQLRRQHQPQLHASARSSTGSRALPSTGCAGSNYSGPAEFSEPETRNEIWVQTNFPNIKFANNIHSSGGLFMWPPGAYTPAARGAAVPAVRHAELLRPDGEPRARRDQVLPRHGDPAAADGSRDRRPLLRRRQLAPTRRTTPTASSVTTSRSATTHYNDTGPATCARPAAAVRRQPTTASPRASEAGVRAGNYGLLQSAYDYENDTAAPVVGATVTSDGKGTYQVRFTSNEASSIYYTTDGSTPDHGVDRVGAAAPPRAAAAARPRARDEAPVDREGLQGQRLGGQVAGARPDRHLRHGRRQRPGDAGPDDGRAGAVRRVHPGRGQGVHGDHHRHRHLDGR